jgi:hypothetical protein
LLAVAENLGQDKKVLKTSSSALTYTKLIQEQGTIFLRELHLQAE